MCIGVLFVDDAGRRAGRVEAISQDEFLGYFSRNGCEFVSTRLAMMKEKVKYEVVRRL